MEREIIYFEDGLIEKSETKRKSFKNDDDPLLDQSN